MTSAAQAAAAAGKTFAAATQVRFNKLVKIEKIIQKPFGISNVRLIERFYYIDLQAL